MSVQALFDAVGLAPSLPRAKCRGRHHLFDEPDPGVCAEDRAHVEQTALTLCHACPSLTRCADWVDSLPPAQRPFGVIGGRVRRSRTANGGNPRGGTPSPRPHSHHGWHSA